jgi:hypothetical protein
VAFLNWRLGLTQMTAWRIEVAPVPGLSNVATPTKDIITIPITLCGYGNGDNAEERGPDRRRDGREHGKDKADKVRRCSRLVRPLGARKKRNASGCSISLTTRSGSSSSLCRSVSSCRSLGDERSLRVFATSALSTLL